MRCYIYNVVKLSQYGYDRVTYIYNVVKQSQYGYDVVIYISMYMECVNRKDLRNLLYEQGTT